eukprot:TRINITY_DN18_c0_g2_i1.p1 TRINITY_DN18_c0_g2~~TRINITY_DN18_c0_g2_i1.p1  ORF type:complete len:597 (-),score=101.26 TRINITY_DN18_c0_g2_i1:3460-5250(-)
MKRTGSIKEIVDIALELPAGAVPYEEFDFEPYFEEAQNEEELRKTWRVFTKVKDVLDNGRRLENASWRLWHRERAKTGAAPPDILSLSTATDAEKYHLDTSIKQAEQETDRIVGDMFGGVGQRFQEENAKVVQQARAERTRALLEMAEKHQLADEVVNDILGWVSSSVITAEEVVVHQSADLLPDSAKDARDYIQSTVFMPRPRVAAFCHSLERNGANNFLLYLVRELREQLSFEVYSPKEGAMRADYEAMGIQVSICNMKLVSYPQDVRAVLKNFQYAIANTIMTTEVINAARDLNVPCLWVIHEAWPKDQFNYYAKEVFMMTHLDEQAIRDAFANASKIVFPANVQRNCYDGLFDQKNARVIYNGIPLASINAFRAVQSRDKVRKELGYGPEDMLLVHMGTVCKRKAQLVTCQAFAELVMNGPLPDGKNYKLLMVGARYIRQHEIDYIEECKQTLEAVGAEKAATILDVKKNVLPFYLAADIILCPSINEVLPLVICEGMAFERPVIATRIDGIPEALDDGVEGLLIEPNNPMALYDAIEKLATNEELRRQMGTCGRKRVLSQFSFATMSKTYRETIGLDLEMIPNGRVVDVKA